MLAVKLETQEPVRTGIKKTFEVINGQKVPVYKIPTGMSGSGSKPFSTKDETEDLPETSQEAKMNHELQKFYDNGRQDDSYVEETFSDIIALEVQEDLFDEY